MERGGGGGGTLGRRQPIKMQDLGRLGKSSNKYLRMNTSAPKNHSGCSLGPRTLPQESSLPIRGPGTQGPPVLKAV